ncbi:MAG: TusE/DsrC/DsvC family sulfur relay protein [Alphaproteobacteria bacterium]|nr:TusE/DsrC/DsvC family sulfur relay protein [Alphaproteobacteria bacterium]
MTDDVDINKAIRNDVEAGDPAAAVRANEVANWTREGAIEAARAEGLDLGDEHFAVIELLQKLYVERGAAPHARYLANILNEEFERQGGSRYLYQLFPGGPVGQGSRLAGVPAPHDTADLSFGSTY